MKKSAQFGARLLFALFLIQAFVFNTASRTWAASGNEKYAAGELLIQPKAGVPESKINAILKPHGATSLHEIKPIRVRQIKVPAQALEKVKAALAKNPHISFVENNFIAEGAFEPNDERYPSQWHLPKISAADGWNLYTGSASVPVAVIDSGIDPTHPDLSDKLIPGYNFLDGNTDTRDVRGHGTAVAGTAAAISNNVQGVAGVCWENPIMPLVVLNADNYATYYNIARAITYAADQNIRVMNISIGGSSRSSTLQNAVNYAWNKGAVIVACAQNYSTSTPYYPAACDNVLAVSATTSSDTMASFSNYGNWIDIAAPGTSILTTTMGGGYGKWNGTSFSSPIAAGLAALILSANPSLTNSQVVDIISRTADDLGDSGFDPYFGYGRVNIYESLLAAVENAPEPDTTKPIVSIASPENGSSLSGSLTVTVSAADDTGVESVALYIDGELFAADTAEPYDFYWDTTLCAQGYHELAAVACDGSQNESRSASVTVYVSRPQEDAPQDEEAPSVAITSPENGSSLSGSLSVTVSAADDTGVESVALYIDGELFAADTAEPYDFYWDTTLCAQGYHELAAVACDGSQNESRSASVTVYVSRPQDSPPSVSITSPADGSSVSDRVKIFVSASDNEGLSRMEIYIDGILKTTKQDGTFETTLFYNWNARKESSGAHRIEAKACDTAGNMSTDSITVYKR